jgi:hypothetical protein
MEPDTYAALTTPTTANTEHLNLDDFDEKYTELTDLRASVPARKQSHTSTNNNTSPTKRVTPQQTPPLVNHPTVAA